MTPESKIVGFIPTQNAERALDFYQNVLGLRFISDDSFAIVLESNGTMIRLVRTSEFTPAPYTILGWQVEDIDSAVKELLVKSLIFQRYSFLEQNEDGIWTAPEGAKVAWFRDPDGNVFSLSRNTNQNSNRIPSCTCRSWDCPVEAAVNVPNGCTFSPSAATVAAS